MLQARRRLRPAPSAEGRARARRASDAHCPTSSPRQHLSPDEPAAYAVQAAIGRGVQRIVHERPGLASRRGGACAPDARRRAPAAQRPAHVRADARTRRGRIGCATSCTGWAPRSGEVRDLDVMQKRLHADAKRARARDRAAVRLPRRAAARRRAPHCSRHCAASATSHCWIRWWRPLAARRSRRRPGRRPVRRCRRLSRRTWSRLANAARGPGPRRSGRTLPRGPHARQTRALRGRGGGAGARRGGVSSSVALRAPGRGRAGPARRAAGCGRGGK